MGANAFHIYLALFVTDERPQSNGSTPAPFAADSYRSVPAAATPIRTKDICGSQQTTTQGRMSTHLFGSTVLMALLLMAIFVGLARLGRRQRQGQGSGGLPAKRDETAMGRVSESADNPATLGAIFVVVVLAAGATTVGAVGGAGGLPNAFAAVTALLGLLVTGFLFLGTYVVVRQHGLGRAQGLAAGLFGVGGVGVLVIAANLVFQFAG